MQCIKTRENLGKYPTKNPEKRLESIRNTYEIEQQIMEKTDLDADELCNYLIIEGK